jgi:hypothetical protein
MPVYEVRGLQVTFPFEAYECQLIYMEKVVEALQTVRLIHASIVDASCLQVWLGFELAT